MLRFFVLFTFFAMPSFAHQLTEPLLRQVVVERAWFSTHVTVRLPATLLYAPAAAARSHLGEAVTAPLLIAERTHGGLIYRVDIDEKPDALAPLVATTVNVVIGDKEVHAQSFRFVDVRQSSHIEADPATHSAAADHPSRVMIEAKYRVWGSGNVTLDFPVDATAFPPFIHIETEVEDLRTGTMLRKVGPLFTSLELRP